MFYNGNPFSFFSNTEYRYSNCFYNFIGVLSCTVNYPVEAMLTKPNSDIGLIYLKTVHWTIPFHTLIAILRYLSIHTNLFVSFMYKLWSKAFFIIYFYYYSLSYKLQLNGTYNYYWNNGWFTRLRPKICNTNLRTFFVSWFILRFTAAYAVINRYR